MPNRRLAPFGTSIFAEMTALANQYGAINLAQGFPDFEGPPEILEAAVRALRDGHNQYARSMGHPKLVEAIAGHQAAHYALTYDPYSEVSVFCGATEGIAAALLGLLNTGDEVIVFEPFYDSYPALAAVAGATVRYATLRFPDFALDADALAGLFSDRTRVLLLNSPHNPTGKVFDRHELMAIAKLCQEHDTVVVADEVYEHLTFDGLSHLPIATLPGMRERTLTLSSTGKTFSFTGWKVGWATGPADLIAAAQSAHQFLTFCAATPLQVAMSTALAECGTPAYFDRLRQDYTARRDFLLAALTEAGFQPAVPQGTYFILAGFDGLWEGDDKSLAAHLIRTLGVAAIPPSSFYHTAVDEGRQLLRFAFCKRDVTLQAAAERLGGMRSAER